MPIRFSPAFSGKVYVNYPGSAKTIANYPYGNRNALIGNMNTLKSRLEEQTPDDKVYSLSISEDKSSSHRYYAPLILSVIDEKGTLTENKFIPETPEQIWHEGFEDITKKVIKGDLKQPKSSLTPKEQVIYDSIIPRGKKVEMDREKIAKVIANASRYASEDSINALIGNINTLTNRIAEHTSKEKNYKLTVLTGCRTQGIVHQPCGDDDFVYIAVDSDSTREGTYDRNILLPKYAPEDLWQDVFKPLTEKILWDGYNHLNSSYSENDRQIKDVIYALN